MAIKYTIQGFLIYGTMAAYALAFLMLIFRLKLIGWIFYSIGFLIAAASFAYRWVDVGHVPLQNLFEVFLCLGLLILPISVLCKRLMGVGAEAGDALVGFCMLFPAGFVFKAEPQLLPPALQSWLFSPHVFAYMFAYMILFKAGVQGVATLAAGKAHRLDYEAGR